MTVQVIPFALQNASHSAAVFRQAVTAPFSSGGVLSAGELGVAAQATPNMSVLIAAGRAMVPGTNVSPPSGFSFTTQASYCVLNDAPVSVTVAASDPTNPRIDLAYVAVQDAFYSGSTNTALVGIVTGIAAPTPIAPALPSNAIALATIAVAANASSIVTANIGTQASLAGLIGAGIHEYHFVVSCATGSGTRLVASQAIPVSTTAQRVVVVLAGSIAIPSGTGASSMNVGVTGAGGTVTLSGGQQVGVSNTGVSYAALATVDITAGSSCTVTISATNAVIFGGTAALRVLPAGTY